MAATTVPITLLTYKYRLLPNRKQHEALRAITESQRQLYNDALQERIVRYRKTGKSLRYIDQSKTLTELRKDEQFSALPHKMQRWTLKRVDDACEGFFRRVRERGKAGFPRFRPRSRWKCFGFSEFRGIRFDGRRLRFKGLPGGLRVHMHRPLPEGSQIRSCAFRRDPKGWFVCFQCAVPAAPLERKGGEVGIHCAANDFAVLSSGEMIPEPETIRQHARALRRRQRALARCRKGSRRRAKVSNSVARLHGKVKNTRRTFLHQLSARLIQSYGRILVDDMNTRNMVRSRFGKCLSHDDAWGTFIQMLEYKAARAGALVTKIDPVNVNRFWQGA
jgi:putative transposase